MSTAFESVKLGYDLVSSYCCKNIKSLLMFLVQGSRAKQPFMLTIQLKFNAFNRELLTNHVTSLTC